MKTNLLLGLLWLFTTVSYSQILFEKGYFIENDGDRVDCLIRNADWKNNPRKFRFKESESGETQTADINGVREFGIPGTVLFKRYEVEIDRRSYLPRELNFNRNPDLKKERLFLKTLVSGKASLYVYEDGNLIRYFYSLESAPPKQLIYTRYKTENQKILENFYYKSQLSKELKCDGITSTEINDTDYSEKDLMAIFRKYNACSGSENVVYERREERNLFHVSLRPGLDFTSLTTSYFRNNVPDTEFNGQVSWQIGAEMELVLPFNKNKWALTVEPFYRSFKADNDNDTRADYSSLVTAFGLRHYFYIDQRSKVFINGNFGLEFPFKGDFRVLSSATTRDLEVELSMLSNYWTLGAGYNWNNKLSVELRYMLSQDLLIEYEYWSADWSGVSLILGYNLL